MKRAVEILQPHIEAGNATSATKNGRFLLATVKGDVHDIGKNIAGVVLACNNFDVIDLGVMVPAEKIVAAAKEYNVDFIGLSGLITPSLDEMCNVAKELREAGINVPLFIGGATTSEIHTAVKIAPLYDGAVLHVKDAAQNPILAIQLQSEQRQTIIEQNLSRQEALRQEMTKTTAASQNTPAADNRLKIDWSSQTLHEPSYLGVKTIERISIEDVRPYINWRHFYNLWRVQPSSAEAQKIHQEAESLLDKMQHHLQARVGFFSAYATEQSIIIEHPAGCKCCNNIPQQTFIVTPRQAKVNESGIQLSLCDFVAPKGYGDHIGCFAVTVSDAFAKELESLKRNGQEYESLLMQSLGDRLVEAAGEWLHQQVRKSLWGYAPFSRTIWWGCRSPGPRSADGRRTRICPPRRLRTART
jgi:5-methyltetrahydrofolate--homocysteine methyltransferase